MENLAATSTWPSWYGRLTRSVNHIIMGTCSNSNLICVVWQADQKGVLIRRVEPTAPVSKSLKKGDILLSFDGVGIANDGTVPFRSGERISFNYLVSKKYTNEEVRKKTKKWKDYAFRRQLNEKPSIIPGCPGD